MIPQNLSAWLGVVVVLIPATLFYLAGIGWAGVFHVGSTLGAVINGLRLLTYKD